MKIIIVREFRYCYYYITTTTPITTNTIIIMIIVICLIQHDRSIGFFLDDRRWRLSRTITGRPENDEYVQHV